MDGYATDYPLFEQAVTRVVGSYSHDLKLTVVSFISVRAYYAESVNTLLGGIRLQGRLKLLEVLEKLDENGTSGAPGHARMESGLGLYVTADVMSQLRELRMTNTMVLPTQRSIATLLHDLYSPASGSCLLQVLTGRTAVLGATLRTEVLPSWQGGSMEIVHVVSTPTQVIPFTDVYHNIIPSGHSNAIH